MMLCFKGWNLKHVRVRRKRNPSRQILMSSHRQNHCLLNPSLPNFSKLYEVQFKSGLVLLAKSPSWLYWPIHLTTLDLFTKTFHHSVKLCYISAALCMLSVCKGTQNPKCAVEDKQRMIIESTQGQVTILSLLTPQKFRRYGFVRRVGGCIWERERMNFDNGVGFHTELIHSTFIVHFLAARSH